MTHDAWGPWVREDVGVSLHDPVRREGPHVLRGAGVMVVHEGHRLGWPPPDHARRLAVGAAQPPQLALHGHVEDALGGEVERGAGAGAAHLVHPVHQLLPVRVLVEVRLAVPAVRQRRPYLGHGEAGPGAVDVDLGDVRGVALGEVEAPAVEADVGPEPVEPLDELLLDARVEVVDVRGGPEVGAGVRVARAVGVGAVVAADHVGAPVEARVGGAALEDAVDAAAVLALRRAVVDDDVGDGLDALAVERPDEGLELRLVAVLGGVQVVEPARHVSLLGDGLRRRGEPHVRDAGGGDVVHLAHQEVVPSAIVLPRLPVETLPHAQLKTQSKTKHDRSLKTVLADEQDLT
ncbi:hypothetical protein ACQJBY_055848 [Aegilops geniculata]